MMRIVWFALALLVSAPPVYADNAAAKAQVFLKSRHRAVMEIIGPGAAGRRESRARALKAAIGELLDFKELSRRSLGAQWDAIDSDQRNEFVSLLSQLVERSYQRNLESTVNFKVKYGQAEPKGDSILVRTVARSLKNRRAPAVEIDYTLHPTADGYRVYDITTDGVSLVDNYRRQFGKIVRRHGWKDLIARMQKRLADDTSGL